MINWLGRHQFLLCFVFISSLAGLSTGVARVATTLYGVHLNASETLLGVIAGVQSLGLLFMALPVGVMVEQRGPTRLYVIGSIVGGLIYLAVPVVPTALYLAFCTALVSFCMPFRFVALNTVFMQQLAHMGLSKAGWFRGTHMIGYFLLGPMVAVAVIGWAGYPTTFWLVGACFLLTALVAPRVLAVYAHAAGPRPSLGVAELRGLLALCRRDEEMRRVCSIEFLVQAIAQFFAFAIVVLAVSKFQLGAAVAATICTVHGGVFVASLFFSGALLRRLGVQRFLGVGYGMTIGALIVLSLARGAIGLWAGSLMLGLGLGMLQTIALAQFAGISLRAGGGRVAGINAFVGPAGGLIGSLAGGAMGHFLGLQQVFLVFVPLVAWLAWRVVIGAGVQNLEPAVLAEGEGKV